MEAQYHLDKSYLSAPLDFYGIRLCQIGRLYCRPGAVVPTHVHLNWLELTVVTDGRGSVITNGVSCPVGRGDIYLSLPCDAHQIVSDSEAPLNYDFFSFFCEREELRREQERIVAEYLSPTRRIFRDDRIRALIGDAIAEFGRDGLYAHELLSAIFTQILVYLFRDLSGEVPAPQSHTVMPAETLCYRLMNYIDTHVYSMKGLGELGEVMGYSYGYLSTLFKKTTGETLAGYYHEKRLETARLLLLERRLSSTEIAEALGYASVYVFSRAFAAKFGRSPRHYRRENGEE